MKKFGDKRQMPPLHTDRHILTFTKFCFDTLCFIVLTVYELIFSLRHSIPYDTYDLVVLFINKAQFILILCFNNFKIYSSPRFGFDLRLNSANLVLPDQGRYLPGISFQPTKT